MKNLIALFTLKPHADNLCSLKANMWLVLLRGSIALIAGCEAAAWGFIGYLMAEATHPWIAAVLIGGAVGCLIGGLDAAFVMVDLSAFRRNEPVAKEAQAASLLGFFSDLRTRFTKAHLGVLVRMVMVAVSLMITAPFLAQLLFSRDIAARQQRGNNKALAIARAEIATRYQQQKQQLTREIGRLEDNRSREIAGRGLSRRYGTGPVSQSLTEQIKTLNENLEDLTKKSTLDLRRFDSADPATLARQYGVVLASDGIVARFEALREMEKIQGFRWTENAFRILLAGFFFGLIIFKWYEPRALEIYYDEELQGAYEDFCAGRLDSYLVESASATSKQVSPFWFAECHERIVKVRKHLEKMKEQYAAITTRQDLFEVAAAHLTGDSGKDMEALQARRAEILQELEPLRAILQQELDEAGRIGSEIAQCEAQLVDFPTAIAAVPDIQDAKILIAKKGSWDERLRAAKAAERRQFQGVAEAQRRHDAKKAELTTLETLIESSGRALAALTDGIINARIKAVHDLGDAQMGG